jgi:hypothetical protein
MDTGSGTERAMRAVAANISGHGVCSPSGYPSMAEIAALVVAAAG